MRQIREELSKIRCVHTTDHVGLGAGWVHFYDFYGDNKSPQGALKLWPSNSKHTFSNPLAPLRVVVWSEIFLYGQVVRPIWAYGV